MSGCVPAGDRSTCLLVQRLVDALSASRRLALFRKRHLRLTASLSLSLCHSLQSRMEWLRKASHESFWTLPPHLAQDLATVAASRDANSYDGGRANSRGPLTVASERRWRAELRMREAEARMEAQRCARDTCAQNSSEGPAAGEGGGGGGPRAGQAGGRGVSGKSDREPTAERQQIELLSLRLRSIQVYA